MLAFLLIGTATPGVFAQGNVAHELERITSGAPILTDDDWRDIVHLGEKNLQEAMRYAERWLSRAEADGDKRTLLNAIRFWVRCVISGAKPEVDTHGLHNLIERGLDLANELDDQDARGWLLYEKAVQHRYQRADHTRLLDQADDIAKKRNIDRLAAFILAERASNSRDSGNASQVMEWLTNAYALFEGRQDKRGMAHVLYLQVIWNLRAASSWDQETGRKLLAYAEKGLELIDAENNPNMYAFHEVMGHIFEKSQEYEQARQYYRLAAAGAEKARSKENAFRMRYNIALSLDREGRYTETLPLLKALLSDMKSEGGEKGMILLTIANLARVHAVLGQAQESLSLLQQAGLVVSQVSDRGDSAPLRGYLSSASIAYAELGDYKRAYEKLKALRTEDRRMERANVKKLEEEYKVRFDVQLKDSENALLRSQKREAENRKLALSLALALTLLLLAAVWYYFYKRAAYHKALAAAEATASQAKSAFVSNMSHELRSPLNVILGFTQLLMRDHDLPEAARRDLGAVYKSGNYLYTLINQVLDLSKIEAGHMTLNDIEFDLYALLDELLEMLSMTAREKELHLAVDSAPDVPRQVRTDAVKLRQVLLNFLGNALKFTRQGSVAMQVEVVSREAQACLLRFTVRDTGPGIAEHELRQLGQAFVQSQAGRESREGTGLGLALSSAFIRLMGGKLEMSSELGQGTTIAFDLPVTVVERPLVEPAALDTSRVIGMAPGQPAYRILVVDDYELNRQLLARLLEPVGFEVRTAGDGKEAVAIFEAWDPHLIWMDIRMPVMNGVEAARRIRSGRRHEQTKLIALTASSFMQDKEQLLSEGFDDYLRKPFRTPDLFELMHKHLGVEYLYDGDTQNILPAATADAAAGPALPESLRAELKAALRDLDATRVERLVEQLRDYDAALSDTLATMARRYDYEGMLEVIGGRAI